MNTKDNLVAVLTASITPVVFALMYVAAKRKPRRIGNVSIVEYPTIAKVLGIVAIGGSALMLFAAFRTPEKERIIAISICGAFSLLFFFLPVEFFFRRIEFDDQCIVVHCAWRNVRRIPWADVRLFTQPPGRREWVLDSKSHGKIQFSSFLQGLEEFRAAVSKRGLGGT